MHAAIADKKEDLVQLRRRHGVARLEVFGSVARGKDFDPCNSDADFLLKFRRINCQASLEQYLEFAEALRQTLGRPVDLAESGAVKNPYLRAAIDKSRELIFAA